VSEASLLQTGLGKVLIIPRPALGQSPLGLRRAFCTADADGVTSIWIARCGMGSGSLEPINDMLRIG
jgi:hypothetical protein